MSLPAAHTNMVAVDGMLRYRCRTILSRHHYLLGVEWTVRVILESAMRPALLLLIIRVSKAYSKMADLGFRTCGHIDGTIFIHLRQDRSVKYWSLTWLMFTILSNCMTDFKLYVSYLATVHQRCCSTLLIQGSLIKSLIWVSIPCGLWSNAPFKRDRHCGALVVWYLFASLWWMSILHIRRKALSLTRLHDRSMKNVSFEQWCCKFF